MKIYHSSNLYPRTPHEAVGQGMFRNLRVKYYFAKEGHQHSNQKLFNTMYSFEYQFARVYNTYMFNYLNHNSIDLKGHLIVEPDKFSERATGHRILGIKNLENYQSDVKYKNFN